jgi:hypothetical protein
MHTLLKFQFGIIVICFFFLLPLRMEAQDKPSYLLQPEYYLSGDLFLDGSTSMGSQYYIEVWLKGDVMLKTGHKVSGQLLRYNGFIDEILWLPSVLQPQVKVDKDMISHFTLFRDSGDTIEFVNISFTPRFLSEQINILAQQLHKGHISLLVHRKIIQNGTLSERTDRGTYLIPVLRPKPVYYLLFDDQPADVVKRFSRRSLARLFPGNEKKVRKHLREHDIRIRNEKELTHAVKKLDDWLQNPEGMPLQ